MRCTTETACVCTRTAYLKREERPTSLKRRSRLVWRYLASGHHAGQILRRPWFPAAPHGDSNQRGRISLLPLAVTPRLELLTLACPPPPPSGALHLPLLWDHLCLPRRAPDTVGLCACLAKRSLAKPRQVTDAAHNLGHRSCQLSTRYPATSLSTCFNLSHPTTLPATRIQSSLFSVRPPRACQQTLARRSPTLRPSFGAASFTASSDSFAVSQASVWADSVQRRLRSLVPARVPDPTSVAALSALQQVPLR